MSHNWFDYKGPHYTTAKAWREHMNSDHPHSSTVTERSRLLQEADGIVNKDRNSIYGNPEDNFKDIANLWTAYKGQIFTTMDVVIMNMLIKVARLKTTPEYRDGLVDIAGYAACGADIQAAMKLAQVKKDLLTDYNKPL